MFALNCHSCIDYMYTYSVYPRLPNMMDKNNWFCFDSVTPWGKKLGAKIHLHVLHGSTGPRGEDWLVGWLVGLLGRELWEYNSSGLKTSKVLIPKGGSSKPPPDKRVCSLRVRSHD